MITAFVEVWEAVSTFLTTLFNPITALFWSGESLTFVGTMAVIMAGISIVLLVFNLIRSFFSMHG